MSIYNKTYFRNVSISVNENTSTVRVDHDFQVPVTMRMVLITINLILAVFGTFGNFLIIFAVLSTPHIRRKVSNFILLSLAVADLLVTVVIQPLYAAQMIMSFFHRCSLAKTFGIAWNVLGVLSTLSSVLHLACISVDRAICTAKPHQYRDIIKKWYKVMIGACWGAAFVSSCTYSVFRLVYGNMVFVSPLFIAIPLLSLTIMLASYGTILCKIKSTTIAPSLPALSAVVRDRAMENRVSKTIGIVILLFFACWIPPIVIPPIVNLIVGPKLVYHCGNLISKNLPWFLSVTFANSSMNFLVYSLRIRHFRIACRRIITKTLQKFREAVAC